MVRWMDRGFAFGPDVLLRGQQWEYQNGGAGSVAVFDGDGEYLEGFVPRELGLSTDRLRWVRTEWRPLRSSFPASGTYQAASSGLTVRRGPISMNSASLMKATGINDLSFGPDMDETVSDLFVGSSPNNDVLLYSGADQTFLGVFIAPGTEWSNRPEASCSGCRRDEAAR
jgi:hypothetical protein